MGSKKIKRIKINFLRKANDELPQLVLNENNIIFQNLSSERKIISFSDINKIEISLVNRIYNPSIGILKDGLKGFLAHRNAGQFSIYFNYYIDLNIYSNECAYFFESSELEEASKFILELGNKIAVEDDLDLLNLFKLKSFEEARDYIDKNYKIWAKRYNLENPRTTLDSTMTKLVRDKLNK